MSALSLVPITLGAARVWIEAQHSHHHAPVGGLYAVGVASAGALPLDVEADARVRASVGVVNVLPRGERVLPLFEERS